MSSGLNRRDFLNGTLLGFGSMALSPLSGNPLLAALLEDFPYPPALMGLRGSHEGAFEAMHEVAWAGKRDWGSVTSRGESYDLAVVGAGISGLASALFYRQKYPDAKIVILDNHDDFGGHARRNEFVYQGKTYLSYGGSQSLEDPYGYSRVSRGVLEQLGVDLEQFEEAYDLGFYARHGLRIQSYFDAEHFGRRALVPFGLSLNELANIPGLLPGRHNLQDAMMQIPLKEEAKRELQQVLQGKANPDSHEADISYFEFLKSAYGVKCAEVLEIVRHLTSSGVGYGADGFSLEEAVEEGLPGTTPWRMPPEDTEWLREIKREKADQYIYHFPDGNATIAQLMVRKLIPQSSPEGSLGALLNGQVRYSVLDHPDSAVRLRLNSTVIHVEQASKSVNLTYLQRGKPMAIKAQHCVMACWNGVIPHIVPSLPSIQKRALSQLVKAPLVYTNVLLKNWHSLKNLGLGYAYCPGRLHAGVSMDFPVNMGRFHAPKSPADPAVLHMEYIPLGREGSPIKEQFKEGRATLLGMSFNDFEKEIFAHLDGMLAPGGFDPVHDIAAITVNRWSHGYSYEGNSLFDPEFDTGHGPHILGRRAFGNITIANADSGGYAYLDGAIDQAWRAVSELS